MKDKIIRHFFVSMLLVVCILQFSLYSQATTLSNKMLAWGFRRGENHEQATLDAASEKVIRDFEGISII